MRILMHRKESEEMFWLVCQSGTRDELIFLNLCKIVVSMEFVFGSFSHFYIEIAYSNFTFCGA